MGVIDQVRRHKIRFCKTFLIYLALFVLGICVILPGPTLLDLTIAAGVSLENINIIYPIGAVGYCGGSIVTAAIFDRLNPHIFLGTNLLLMGVASIALPWFRSIIGVAIVFFLIQLAGGAIDCGGCVWILALWGSENQPFMQMAHFFFGLGAFVAPLIAEPFLLPTSITEEPTTTLASMTDDLVLNTGVNHTNANVSDLLNYEANAVEMLRIQVPYGIAGAICIILTVLLLVMWCLKPNEKPHESNVGKNKSMPPLRKWIVVIVSGLYLMGFACIEIVFPRYLTTFAVKSSMQLSKSTGAYMTSVYWFAYTFFRLVTAYFVQITGPSTLLFGDSIAMLIGTGILWFFSSEALQLIDPEKFAGKHANEIGVWVGVAMIGTGASSVFPAMYGYLEQYMTVSSRVAGAMILIFSLGEFIYPLIVGAMIETLPMIVVYLAVASAIVSCMAYSGIWYGLTRYSRNQKANQEVGVSPGIEETAKDLALASVPNLSTEIQKESSNNSAITNTTNTTPSPQSKSILKRALQPNDSK